MHSPPRAAWRLQINATTADVSLCSRAHQIQQANIPLQLVSGWLDNTAAAAINLYHCCGQAPGALPPITPAISSAIQKKSVIPAQHTMQYLTHMPVVALSSTRIAHSIVYLLEICHRGCMLAWLLACVVCSTARQQYRMSGACLLACHVTAVCAAACEVLLLWSCC